MSVDHMERTAMDLRQAYDPDSTHALLEARTVASRLVRGETVPRAETGHVIDQLAAELRRLCAIIDVEARACGIEAGR